MKLSDELNELSLEGKKKVIVRKLKKAASKGKFIKVFKVKFGDVIVDFLFREHGLNVSESYDKKGFVTIIFWGEIDNKRKREILNKYRNRYLEYKKETIKPTPPENEKI